MHPFTDPQLTRDTQDLFHVRSSILKAVKAVKPRFQGSLLDIGCGVMPYRDLLLAAPTGITRYIGMDLGSQGIYKKVPPDIEWDGRTAPLTDASVDNAMAIEVLEHCPDPIAVLREAHRVMRPGGRFFFTVPFLWPLHDVPYDEHRYTPFAMERMLKDAGFSEVILTPHGGWNASLAQMIGLWVQRGPMSERRRGLLKRITLPLVRRLLRGDGVGNLQDGPMITGLSGTADETSLMNLRTAIISPNREAWSETFIANHIAHLPRVDLVLTDGHLPKRDIDGNPLLAPTLVKRVMQRVRKTDPQEMLRGTIARLLKKHRIDVVLAEYGPTGEAMLEVCQRAGVPLVVHFHGIDAFHTRLLKENGNYQRIITGARAIVVVSREMESQLLALGCPREKLHYNCYGIEVDRFTAATPATSPKHFLAVGRFVDKKAPHLTLQAFHKAWLRDPGLRLTMAGNGPLWESTRQLAQAEGLGDVVEFPGVITNDQVAERMREVRAFVQHSVVTADNDHEGTPLSILEAMASGLPVIATRHAGIPDVIDHGVEGLLCAERDIEGMAAHIITLAEDAALAARLGAAGRARTQRDHRLEGSIRGLAGILAGAVAR